MLEIIKQLLAEFGPLLVALVRAWLESALKRAAKKVDADGMSPAGAAVALVQQAIDDTPKLAFGKRALLRLVRDNAGRVALGHKLTDPHVRDEVADAGKGAARDK